jgi:phosphate transport system ATP-binding protein
VSDFTGFSNLDGVGQPGHLVEFGETDQIFDTPHDETTKRHVSGNFG